MTPQARSLFPALARSDWWGPFVARREASSAGLDLPVALAAAGHADPAAAMAHTILAHPSVLSPYAVGTVPAGLTALARAELWRLAETLRRVVAPTDPVAAGSAAGKLSELAPPALDPDAEARVGRLARELLSGDADAILGTYLALLREVGNGPASLHPALTWAGGALVPVLHPDAPAWEELAGLDEPLARLAENTEAHLAGRRANDCLLYGARGSGKSTAVRGLLGRFAGRGLRIVEVTPANLEGLGDLLELLRPQPLRFVLFVDDLAFEADDDAYRPLKSLLDGGLRRRPDNTLVYATSNRRHLVRERLSDRPDPLDDDVHAWDTHQERLALADRFGLVITFPSADQRRYLELVRSLAERRGLALDPELTERALRFAEWNNGLSGRTARQFVDSTAAAAPRGD